MEQFFDLKSQGELVSSERVNFKEVLLRIHQMLAKNNQSKKEMILIYLIASIYLANVCEEDGDYRSAVQIMRSALSRVVETREMRLKKDLEYSSNPVSAMHVHLHKHKIIEIQKAKQERYKIWENLILRKERERKRAEKGLAPLDEDEADEEASEIERLENEKHAFQDYLLSQNKAEGEPAEGNVQKAHEWKEKEYYEFYSTLDDLINDLHIEVLACLYRWEIKLGQDFRDYNLKTTKMLKIKGIKAPNEATAGLSTTMKKRFTMKNTKSIAKATNDFKGLQQTLQEAGKIPVSRPQATNFEKIVMLENGHNFYQNALFSMQVSISKDNSVEQKSLLMESLEYIKKAVDDEEKLKKIIIDNSAAVKIAEHLTNCEERGQKVYEKPPLNLMDKSRYLKKTNVPPKPIFLARTTTTITMKLPYFRPITDHKDWRNISKMALFGKESGSGVAVSLNNTEFPGTGDKVDQGAIVTVSGLIPNKKYVFACGGYTHDGICVNGIGETSEEILTALPLNYNILYGYLAQIAFKLRQFAISKKAAETLLSQFIEKNETRYRMLNTEKNPALQFKLKYSDINMVSVTTIRQIVEAFLILADISKIQKPNFDKNPSSIDSIAMKHTKVQLRICNFLLLALELSILLKNPILTKRTLGELFDHTLPFLSFEPRPEFLRNYLLYIHQSILTIPVDQMDSPMRRIGSCLAYEVNKDFIANLKGEEHELYHRVLRTELMMELRKWQTYSIVVTKLDKLTEEQEAKKKEQREAIANGQEIPKEEIIKDPEPYDVTEFYCDEFEKEPEAYEQFLFKYKTQYAEERAEKWKAKLQKLAPKLTNGEEVIENLIGDLDTNISFWKGIKESPESQINNEALKEHPRFLEFVCIAFKKIINMEEKPKEEIRDLMNNVKLGEEEIQDVEENINKTKENLSHDVVQRRKKRYDLIEEKVKTIISNTENVDITMVDLDKLFNDIRKELASSEQFEKTEFNQAKTRYLLQVSQFLFLKAMVKNLINRKKFDYKVDIGLPSYQDVQLLDFSDFVSQVNDFKESALSERQRIRSELVEKMENEREEGGHPADESKEEPRVPDEEEIQIPVDERIKAISDVINLLSRSCQYSRNSKSWVLLENVVKYTWNLITYELVSPLELSQTDAYKDIFLMAE